MSVEAVMGIMKPQDQVIYLLGEVSGKLDAMSDALKTSNENQATINARVSADIELARGLAEQAKTDIAALAARLPQRAPWWHAASGIAAVVAVIVALPTALTIILK